MTVTVQNVVHQETISITSDMTVVIQEMKSTTRSSARYVAFRLLQRVPGRNLHSSVLTADVLLRKSNNAKTLTYTSAGTSVVHTGTTRV